MKTFFHSVVILIINTRLSWDCVLYNWNPNKWKYALYVEIGPSCGFCHITPIHWWYTIKIFDCNTNIFYSHSSHSCATPVGYVSKPRRTLASPTFTPSSSPERMAHAAMVPPSHFTRRWRARRSVRPCRLSRPCTWLNSVMCSHGRCTHISAACTHAAPNAATVQNRVLSATSFRLTMTRSTAQRLSALSHKYLWWILLKGYYEDCMKPLLVTQNRNCHWKVLYIIFYTKCPCRLLGGVWNWRPWLDLSSVNGQVSMIFIAF